MNKTKTILRWFLVVSLSAILLAGCSGTQNSPTSADLGRDQAVSLSTENVGTAFSGPNVEYLGTAIDPQTGLTVEGYMFTHPAGPEWDYSTSARMAEADTSCYGFLADGAYWKNVEDWVFNPINSDGLTDSFLLANESADIAKWEDAADGVVGDGLFVNILGNGLLTNAKVSLSQRKPDGQNAVLFGKLSKNTIAVTVIWGVFSGPISNRVLTEWDQEFNDFFYTWSMSGETGKMDFENIATHELGHAVGLDDQYSTSCSEVTMYGYGSNGETKKRTLEAPDITGISTLY